MTKRPDRASTFRSRKRIAKERRPGYTPRRGPVPRLPFWGKRNRMRFAERPCLVCEQPTRAGLRVCTDCRARALSNGQRVCVCERHQGPRVLPRRMFTGTVSCLECWQVAQVANASRRRAG